MNDNLVLLGFIGLFAIVFFIVGFCFCELTSTLTEETKIVDVSESDILWDEDDFYVIAPDGEKITLGIDGGEIIDLTKH